MLGFVPKEMFLTKGVGKHREKLTSFELALRFGRHRGLQPRPRVEHLPAELPDSVAQPGHEAPRAGAGHLRRHVGSRDARAASADRGHRRRGHPARPRRYGYLSEHHSFGESEDIAGDYAEELAAEMLATTLGLDFDPDKSWDEKKEVYRLSKQIVRTQNVTQTAVGDKKGLWTTVVAAAVLVD